jgi:chloramphenicol-sensitive protein RarD
VIIAPSQRGGLLAVAAFAFWGVFPFYFKLISHLSPLEVLANRIIWSTVCLLFLLFTLKKYWHIIVGIFLNKIHLIYLTASTLLIATNWGVYIWAVDTNRLFEASLGYYINPLFNVFLGFILLKEVLSRTQCFAVALAAVGVGIQIIALGEIPWIALTLAFSFGLYGFIHKKVAVDVIPGLFVEVLLLLPIALIYLGGLWMSAESAIVGPISWTLSDWSLLMLAGPVTVIPLLLFTAAAKRLTYSALGFFQYITPTTLFLLALFFYQEPFSLTTLLTFILIWMALALLSFDVIKSYLRSR